VNAAWLSQNWLLVASLGLCAAGVAWLLPRRRVRLRGIGWLFVLVGGALVGGTLPAAAGVWAERVLFVTFGGGAVLCGVLMVTSRNPAYAALWFALVTLCTCGLFLLQAAPFLAAATIIVYAGAIIVTFLFVIMLAQQAGAAQYDQRSQHPLAATFAAFVLLGALLATLHSWESPREATAEAAAAFAVRPATNPLSRPAADEAIGTMRGLGRSLFGDYLFAVELAGTLLLVASIGAIAIAPRRPQGTL
jgi:NADH-quinone oxidoreductase subunit J